MIILDAFQSDKIPAHMSSKEFFQQVASILHPKGVVVANVLLDRKTFHSLLKTFRSVYGRCYVFMGRRTKNAILLSPGPEAVDLTNRDAVERAAQLQRRYKFRFDLNDVVRQFRPHFRLKFGTKILTDKDLIQ